MPKFDRQRAREHLQALAFENDIEIVWVASWVRAEATSLRAIAIPRVREARDYLVGLHELGHCLSRESRYLGNAETAYEVIGREGWAWAWAAENVDPQLARQVLVRDWDKAGKGFSSYLRYTATLVAAR